MRREVELLEHIFDLMRRNGVELPEDILPTAFKRWENQRVGVDAMYEVVTKGDYSENPYLQIQKSDAVSLACDGVTVRNKNYLGTLIRHLDEAKTGVLNTVVALKPLHRPVLKKLSLLSMLFKPIVQM